MPEPAPPSHIRRFRTNPVELGIFAVITLIFFNSVYNLFYDQQGFHPAALTPMAANPVSEGRSPASAPQAFVNVDFRCESNADVDTQASKVRITGPICAPAPAAMTATAEERAPAADGALPGATPELVSARISNGANKYQATVFPDVNAGKFSTDYIPLNLGRNPIHIVFNFHGDRQIEQDINIVKN